MQTNYCRSRSFSFFCPWTTTVHLGVWALGSLGRLLCQAGSFEVLALVAGSLAVAPTDSAAPPLFALDLTGPSARLPLLLSAMPAPTPPITAGHQTDLAAHRAVALTAALKAAGNVGEKQAVEFLATRFGFYRDSGELAGASGVFGDSSSNGVRDDGHHGAENS
jgi:hypothetical protein